MKHKIMRVTEDVALAATEYVTALDAQKTIEAQIKALQAEKTQATYTVAAKATLLTDAIKPFWSSDLRAFSIPIQGYIVVVSADYGILVTIPVRADEAKKDIP